MTKIFYLTILLLLFLSISLPAQISRIYWVQEATSNGCVQTADANGNGLTDVITGLSMPCGMAIDNYSSVKKNYICERSANKIIRTNLDGSNPEDVITGVSGIRDIEVDPINRKIYWMRDTYSNDAVQRADMDGLNSNIETLINSTSTNRGYYGIGLDLVNQVMYWTVANNGCNDKIIRMNFDGTGWQTIITNTDITLLNPWDIDVYNNHIYWTDPGLNENRIMRANLDGSGIDTVLTNVECTFFTIDSSEGKIYWGEQNKVYSANLDGSGRTDVVTGLGNSLRGIEIVYNMAPLKINEPEIIAEQFKLEQNYPNPFNPDTQIQFYLPASQMVSLEIFDALGNLVSALLHENLNAGTHRVEWHAGSLPSGSYFYRLKSERFSETKKMILLK